MTNGFASMPRHWRMTRLDRVATVNARIGWKALTTAEYQPEGYAFLATPNIKSDDIDFNNVNYISEFRYKESPELQLTEGDVLLAKDGNTLGIVNVVRHLPRPATVNGSIAVLRPFGIHPRFLRYVLASTVTQGRIEAVKDGMGVPHLFQWDIKRFPLPLPPEEEQRRIADFLDAETVRLDRLGDAIKRETAVLEQRRLRTVELVWDGVEEASRMRLGYATSLVTSGSRGWGEYVSDSGALFFRSANLHSDSIRPKLTNTTYVRVPKKAIGEAARSRIAAGDVMIGITGANSGWVALANDAVAGGHVSQHVCLVRPDRYRINGEWLAYLIASPSAQDDLMSSQYGGTKTQLSLPDIRDLRVPVVSLARQNQVAGEIRRQLTKIDSMRELRFRQLGLLTERRQTLITAAVTGQIDVSTASGRGIED